MNSHGNWLGFSFGDSTAFTWRDVYFRDDITGYVVGDSMGAAGELFKGTLAAGLIQNDNSSGTIAWQEMTMDDHVNITSPTYEFVNCIAFNGPYTGMIGGVYNSSVYTNATIYVYTKIKVVGIVERGEGGRVALKVEERLTGRDLMGMLKWYVNLKKGETTVMTDDFKGYNAFDKVIQHYTVNHSAKQYVRHIENIKDSIHTNTIEGVWPLIKNGIRGQYHVLSKKYLPFYLAEAAYKYNRRTKGKKRLDFSETIDNAVTDKKRVVKYKPKGNVRKIVYREKVGKKPTKKPKPTRKPTPKRQPRGKIIKRTKKQWIDRAKYLNRASTEERRTGKKVPPRKRGRPKKRI